MKKTFQDLEVKNHPISLCLNIWTSVAREKICQQEQHPVQYNRSNSYLKCLMPMTGHTDPSISLSVRHNCNTMNSVFFEGVHPK